MILYEREETSTDSEFLVGFLNPDNSLGSTDSEPLGSTDSELLVGWLNPDK